MHTALECEVTIKPRFVYIPSPRTGPKRGGDCESRDGGGRKGDANPGAAAGGPSGIRAPEFPQQLQQEAASRAERVGRRAGSRGFSCALRAAPGLAAGQPRPRARHPARDLAPAGPGAAWAGRERPPRRRAAAGRGCARAARAEGGRIPSQVLGALGWGPALGSPSRPPLWSRWGRAGAPGWSRRRSSGPGRLTDGGTCAPTAEASWGLVFSQTGREAGAGRAGE